jgi:hypothetical protein
LKLLRRGTGVWVEWNGEPVTDRPAYLPDRWKGNVGLVTWGGGHPARLQVRNLSFYAAQYRVLPVGSRPTTEEVQAAIREAPSLSALSPLWLQLVRAGLQTLDVDRALLSILARRYGWEIVPTLRVLPGGQRSLTVWLPKVLSRAKDEGWSGLRLDVSALPADDREAVRASGAFDREAARAGLRLVLDEEPARTASRVADGALFSREGRP